ncbi:hypothetical protein PtA15_4A660 [Puccinia triticina]|uniref:SAM domain-containing protein n=1 Tax=Puccinia triticina TaxID=208348 RepID=A0ABY7CIL9_9BASI|nr:uncharacterized protein PtA15_4A660 [Puccinia triticina]WAQ84208.1 hypothetical protein PtA15_4A660 [Puccinia triticina]WAR55034.1 hypothetical protein PtB15_4B653 [Puccinia triticina]
MAETAWRIEAQAATATSNSQPTASSSTTNPANSASFNDDLSNADSCDDKFQARAIIEEEIFRQYIANIGVDKHHTVYPHLTDLNRYIILTSSNVALWAKAIHSKEPGVSVLCPPALMKYYNQRSAPAPAVQHPAPPSTPQMDRQEMVATLVEVYHATLGSAQSATSQRVQSPSVHPPTAQSPLAWSPSPVIPVKACNNHAPVIPVKAGDNHGSMADYLRFAGVLNTEQTMQILQHHEVDHYLILGVNYMSLSELQSLGLSVGTLAWLRRNVGQYQQSLAAQRP